MSGQPMHYPDEAKIFANWRIRELCSNRAYLNAIQKHAIRNTQYTLRTASHGDFYKICPTSCDNIRIIYNKLNTEYKIQSLGFLTEEIKDSSVNIQYRISNIEVKNRAPSNSSGHALRLIVYLKKQSQFATSYNRRKYLL